MLDSRFSNIYYKITEYCQLNQNISEIDTANME